MPYSAQGYSPSRCEVPNGELFRFVDIRVFRQPQPLSVSFFSVLEYTLLKYFFKCRPVCVPLTPRYLGHMFVFLQMIGETVYEFVFAQDDLSLNIEHDGFFTDSPFNKLVVFLFCLVSLPAEEDIPCLTTG